MGLFFEPHGVYKLLVKKAKPLEDLGYMHVLLGIIKLKMCLRC